MLQLAGRDIGGDLVSRLVGSRQILEVLLRAISTVGQERSGSLSALVLDHLHHRCESLFIVGRRRHALPHDQLQPRLHCRLRVVTSHSAVVALDEARFGIGEIVLILSRRFRLFYFRARLSCLLRLLPRPLRLANLPKPCLTPLQPCG
jgi:hypothetical protein